MATEKPKARRNTASTARMTPAMKAAQDRQKARLAAAAASNVVYPNMPPKKPPMTQGQALAAAKRVPTNAQGQGQAAAKLRNRQAAKLTPAMKKAKAAAAARAKQQKVASR